MSDETIRLEWRTASSAEAVERVARALCRHDGRNPDLPIQSDIRKARIAADGIAELKPVSVPLWKSYVEEAKRFVVAFRAFHETGE